MKSKGEMLHEIAEGQRLDGYRANDRTVKFLIKTFKLPVCCVRQSQVRRIARGYRG